MVICILDMLVISKHSCFFSNLFLMEKNFKNLIGGVELDKNGNIISAKAILHGFFGKMNTTAALLDVHSITDAMGVYVSE